MPTTLARLLVEAGAVDEAVAAESLRRHIAVGGSLDTVLLEGVACGEAALLQVLGAASGLPVAYPEAYQRIDPKALAVFPFKLADRHGMVPMALGRRHIDVAVAYPFEKLLLEELSFMLGKDLRPHVSLEARIRDAIARHYSRPLAARYANLLRRLPAPPAAPVQTEREVAPAVESVWSPPAPPVPEASEASPFAPVPIVVELDFPHSLADEAGEPSPFEQQSIEEEPVQLAVAPPVVPLVDADEASPFDVTVVEAPALVPTPPASSGEQIDHLPEEVRRYLAWDVPDVQKVEPGIEEAVEAAVTAKTVERERKTEPAPMRQTQGEPDPVRPPPLPKRSGIAPKPVLPSGAPIEAAGGSGSKPREREGIAVNVEAPPGPVEAWSLSKSRAKLAAANGRDEIIDVALRFALKSFDYAAALAVKSGTAFGWKALGRDTVADDKVRSLALPLDAPSVLRTVLRARGRYLGPLPDDLLTQKLLADLGRAAPRAALICPIFVRERPVAFFFADRGARNVSAQRVAELLLFVQDLPGAFERAILAQKNRAKGVRLVAAAPLLTGSAATPAAEPVSAAMAPAAEAAAEDDDDLLFPIVEELPPAFFDVARSVDPIIDDLLLPDRRRRLAAFAELQAMPESAAPALAARFPGPTSVRRGLTGTSLEPDEIGPIAAALARLGALAVPELTRILREGDPDARFFAVILAGRMNSAALFPSLLACLFDPVPEVGAAARAAAVRLRRMQGFDAAVGGGLRAQLASPDADRVTAAARALGMVRDPAAVSLLIPLTGSADDRVAAEASDALALITKQTLGDSPRRWQAWWEGNRHRSRWSWVVEGLRHKDQQVRLSSIEELIEETNDSFGYFAEGSKKDRERAIERWEQWAKSRP